MSEVPLYTVVERERTYHAKLEDRERESVCERERERTENAKLEDNDEGEERVL